MVNTGRIVGTGADRTQPPFSKLIHHVLNLRYRPHQGTSCLQKKDVESLLIAQSKVKLRWRRIYQALGRSGSGGDSLIVIRNWIHLIAIGGKSISCNDSIESARATITTSTVPQGPEQTDVWVVAVQLALIHRIPWLHGG